MSRAIVRSSQVAVHLTLTVTRRDEQDGVQVAVLDLFSLTAILMFIWNVQVNVNRVRFRLARWMDRWSRRLDTAGKVLAVGVNSIRWGVMGV
jgi:hypothetical protein